MEKGSEKISSERERNKNSTIFVGGISFSTNANDIKQLFSMFGKVKRVKIVRNKKGNSKGYSLVKFETPLSAKKALESDQKLTLNTRILDCRPLLKGKSLKKMKESVNKKRISIENLPKKVNAEEKKSLRQIFENFGKIQNFYFAREKDKDGIFSQKLLITYESEEGVDSCLKAVTYFKSVMLSKEPFVDKRENTKKSKKAIKKQSQSPQRASPKTHKKISPKKIKNSRPDSPQRFEPPQQSESILAPLDPRISIVVRRPPSRRVESRIPLTFEEEQAIIYNVWSNFRALILILRVSRNLVFVDRNLRFNRKRAR